MDLRLLLLHHADFLGMLLKDVKSLAVLGDAGDEGVHKSFRRLILLLEILINSYFGEGLLLHHIDLSLIIQSSRENIEVPASANKKPE